jgi:integrase
MYYLGRHGSEASRREYDRIIGEFVANGRQPLYRNDEILVESLIVRFLDHIENEQNYCKSTEQRIVLVLRLLNQLYGKQPVTQFTPTSLKTIRRQLIEEGLSKNVINGRIGIIKQLFCWGSEEEIVPAETALALRTVSSLKSGRTTAVEYADVEPVDVAVVEKTLPYLSPQVQDMVRVQRWISGRTQDVFNMRFCDIDQSEEVWKYMPFTHKTKYKGKTRVIYIGPKAQQILKPYLERGRDDPKQFIFLRQSGKQYVGSVYDRQIAAACKKAGVPHWTPNQLRHAGGTEVRNKFGLDCAQAVLGHSSAKMTEIYAKVSLEKAEKAARELG